MKAEKILGSVGAAALVAAPPFIDTDAGKILTCFGLALLTYQAIEHRLWNLVVLNVAGILGYSYAIFF